MLAALEYAHSLRLVHRDVKPANLLVARSGRKLSVKVADFGLARVCQATCVSGLTLPGDVGGTTAFMAPEQVLDFRGATPAADQYAAAATLYTALTGHFVYDQPHGVAAQLAQILDEEVVPIRDRGTAVPDDLAEVLHRALARDPAERYRGVREFRKALAALPCLRS
jgi:serine/threonine protein kinase